MINTNIQVIQKSITKSKQEAKKMSLKEELKKASFIMDDFTNPDKATEIIVIRLSALQKIFKKDIKNSPSRQDMHDSWDYKDAIDEIEKEVNKTNERKQKTVLG